MEILEYLRGFTIFEYAIFDLALSFGGIYLISERLSRWFLKINIEIPKINWLFLVLPFSILIHIVFQQMTPMTLNFLDLNNYYFLKILILILLFFGLKNIKKIDK